MCTHHCRKVHVAGITAGAACNACVAGQGLTGKYLIYSDIFRGDMHILLQPAGTLSGLAGSLHIAHGVEQHR